jgi:Cu+-exporting ATPase
MAIDPICGMTVDETSPLRAERDGQTFYFCSEHCRKRFVGQTHRDRSHADSASPAHHGHSHHGHATATVKPGAAAKYFCPMCPGVESDQPGDCPKCGMALERNPAWVATASGKTVYTCPMHPDVRQEHPGDCPLCGMPLEPLTVAAHTDAEENAVFHSSIALFPLPSMRAMP